MRLKQWILHQTQKCYLYHLKIQKPVHNIVYHNFYQPNPVRPIQQIGFITSWINPLDLVNIQLDHPLETITNVSSKDRNVIYNLTKEINNIITGITSAGRNTEDTRTNTNYLLYHTYKVYNFNTWWWWFIEYWLVMKNKISEWLD